MSSSSNNNNNIKSDELKKARLGMNLSFASQASQGKKPALGASSTQPLSTR